MNIIGKEAVIVDANDPTKKGSKGIVVLETSNMVFLGTSNGSLMVEKEGTKFLMTEDNKLVRGDEIEGRLEDRLRSTGR